MFGKVPALMGVFGLVSSMLACAGTSTTEATNTSYDKASEIKLFNEYRDVIGDPNGLSDECRRALYDFLYVHTYVGIGNQRNDIARKIKK